MYDEESRNTRAWRYYESGRSYNNKLVPNQYNLVNTNIEFFSGNQWVHLPMTPAMRKLPKPQFNIIKRIVSLFVAQLTSSAVTVTFDELSYYAGDPADDESGREGNAAGEHQSLGQIPVDANAAAIATAAVQNLLEKYKMDFRLREALFDGAQTGDYCAHFYWDADARPYGGAFGDYRGEIRMELVDGINVMFGNPNTPDVQKQPYILIVGRDTVEHLQWEMKRHRKSKASDEDTADIQPDYDTENQVAVGGRTELDADAENGKALYVYLYEMRNREETVTDPETGEAKKEPVLDGNGDPVQAKGEDGKPLIGADGKPIYKMRDVKRVVSSVYVSKCTKSCTIFENVDTGLSRYPIAWGNWEKQKNQYHGRALVTGIIPNQIFINTMFAMVMRHQQLMGFPKTIFNADLISQWNNEVGQAIGVRGLQPGQKISEVAYHMSPADMSNQIIMAIDRAVSLTKDCLGATDAQLGNVQPENTSALMVLQSNSAVPLENPRAGALEWVEDIGAILLDFMGTNYGERPIVRTRDFQDIVTDPSTGQPMLDPVTGTIMTKTTSRRVVEMFDFSKFKHLWYNIRVNSGATTYFSEIAMVQTLDNLRRDGMLEIIDYLERIPDKLVPRKAELIQKLRTQAAMNGGASAVAAPGLGGARSAAAQSKSAGPGVATAMGGAVSKDKALAEMPGATQARFATLPTSAQNALLKQAGMN